MASIGRHRAQAKHDSGQTSSNPRSGTTGKHDGSNPAQQPAKTRTDASKLTSKGWPTPGKK